MKFRLCRAVLLLVLLASIAPAAAAQDFNINCGPGPVPSPAYGAATGQTGSWNGLVFTTSSVPLLDTGGQATGATAFAPWACDMATCSDCGSCPGFSGSADDTALLGSWLNGDCHGIPVDVTIAGLAPGRYLLHSYIYGCATVPSGSGIVSVGTYSTSFSHPGVPFQGTWTGFPVTTHVLDLFSAHSLFVRIWGASYTGPAGFQLEQLEPTGQATCLGDGTGAACPCANYGLPGHGCKNSSTVRGAELAAVGDASLAFDTLGLACEFEPPNVTSVFLQGDQLVAPVVFGDGLRCAGGNLKRLYVTNSSPSGTVSAPANGASSISARSAALGDSIQPPTTRVYQVYYRDPDASFCPEPQGSNFNVSNAVEIVWQP